mgnify:CR=1 FL=1
MLVTLCKSPTYIVMTAMQMQVLYLLVRGENRIITRGKTNKVNPHMMLSAGINLSGQWKGGAVTTAATLNLEKLCKVCCRIERKKFPLIPKVCRKNCLLVFSLQDLS